MKIKEFDAFGLRADNKVSKKKGTIQSNVGAFFTIFTYLSIIVYGCILFQKLVYRRKKTFTSGSLSLDLEKEGLIEMSRF